MTDITELAATIVERAGAQARFMIAIAGPPGAGKSTLAHDLLPHLPPESSVVVPMDGFHYDDVVLQARGLQKRKGAPETFDYRGFEHLLGRIRACEPEIAIPVFDRSIELSRAGASIIEEKTRFVLVEGNYLLLDEAPWRGLSAFFDLKIFIDVPRSELQRRLLRRWADIGRPDAEARAWVDQNDMPNVDRVLGKRRPPDLVV